MLFSYVILCDFFPLYDFQCISNTEEHSDRNLLLKNVVKLGFQQHNRPTTSEIILDVWIFTLFCEEIRQVK